MCAFCGSLCLSVCVGLSVFFSLSLSLYLSLTLSLSLSLFGTPSLSLSLFGSLSSSKMTEYAYMFVCREANKRPLDVSNEANEHEPQKKKAKVVTEGDEVAADS